MPWTTNDIGNQEGKTILVTGSNTGIGFATAKLLASKGAQVILTSRSREKGEQRQSNEGFPIHHGLGGKNLRRREFSAIGPDR